VIVLWDACATDFKSFRRKNPRDDGKLPQLNINLDVKRVKQIIKPDYERMGESISEKEAAFSTVVQEFTISV